MLGCEVTVVISNPCLQCKFMMKGLSKAIVVMDPQQISLYNASEAVGEDHVSLTILIG